MIPSEGLNGGSPSFSSIPSGNVGSIINVSGVVMVWNGTQYVESRSVPKAYGTLRLASIGDSIVRGVGGISLSGCMQSGGRVRLVRNGGVAGENAAQVLARTPAFLDANPCDVLAVGVGTNDGRQGVTDASFETSLRAIFSAAQSRGIKVVYLCPPPNNEGATQRTAIQAKIRVAQKVCTSMGALFSYRFRDSNDGTFAYKAGKNEDSIHPHRSTHWPEGAGLIADMVQAGMLPGPSNAITMSNTDPANLFTNSTLQADAGGLATGITNLGAFTATMEAGELGRRQVATKATNAVLCGFQVAIPGLVSGQKYRFIAKCSLTVSAGTFALQTNNDKSTELAYKFVDAPALLGVGSYEFIYDEVFTASSNGTCTVSIYDNASGASFVLKIEQIRAFNVTTYPEFG